MTATLLFRACCAVVMMASLTLSQGALAQRADNGWRDCANEGQTCRVDGRAVVRYGADDRWSSRVVNGSVACENDAFGDPAPQTPKRCMVREYGGGGGGGGNAGSGRGWSFCAAEGEVCRFRGQAEVRFGSGNRFTTRSAHNQVRCDVDSFGDPLEGVTKHCEIRTSGGNAGSEPGYRPEGGYQGWDGESSGGGWRFCAPEGGTCNVDGRAEVRFGDGRRFNTRTVDGEAACKVSRFGDPAPHVVKHCEVRADRHAGGGGRSWSRCAYEGERCEFNGAAQVRFGTSGRYAYRDAYNGLKCSIDAFGTDPYDGRVKTCEIRR
jgi:hypothetical protein